MVLLVLVSFVLIQPVHAALPDSVLLDSSGNGRHLSVASGDNVVTSEPEGKYGFGVRKTSGVIRNHSAVFNILGDLTWFGVILIDVLPSTAARPSFAIAGTSIAAQGEPGNFNARIQVTSGGAWRYTHQQGVGLLTTLNSPGGSAEAGTLYRIFLTRDAATNTIVLNVNGVEEINAVYALDTTGGEFDPRFGFAFDSGSTSVFTVYESRIWDSLVDTSVLESLQDPGDLTYGGIPVGDELAAYFLEHDCEWVQLNDVNTFIQNLVPQVFLVLVLIAIIGGTTRAIINRVRL